MTIPAMAIPRPLSSLEASMSRSARQPRPIAAIDPSPKSQKIPTISEAIARPLVSCSTSTVLSHPEGSDPSRFCGAAESRLNGLAEVDAREAVLDPAVVLAPAEPRVQRQVLGHRDVRV